MVQEPQEPLHFIEIVGILLPPGDWPGEMAGCQVLLVMPEFLSRTDTACWLLLYSSVTRAKEKLPSRGHKLGPFLSIYSEAVWLLFN